MPEEQEAKTDIVLFMMQQWGKNLIGVFIYAV